MRVWSESSNELVSLSLRCGVIAGISIIIQDRSNASGRSNWVIYFATIERQHDIRFTHMGLFDIFKRTQKDTPQKERQPPRLHHYQFAYRALPGLAFADPHVVLGFGHDIPKGSLVKFWNSVGAKFPENERVSDSGLFANATGFGPHYVILFIDMPKPLRETEAYFVAIIYPRTWINDPSQENSKPDLRYFILAKSEVPSPEGASGGLLRILTEAGHGAVKFGIPVFAEAFLKEIQIALLNPPQCITWIESKSWNFLMQDSETGQTHGAI